MAIEKFQAPRFSLRQLQYAVAVAETGGFGAAARLCGVSQPSLSTQLAKLEQALGVRLFDRDARGVRATSEAERLLEAFRGALAAGGAVEFAAATLLNPYAVPVRVAVIPTIAPYLLPTVVAHLNAQEPGPTVHWLELQTEAAEAALASGRADAIVIADPPTGAGLVVEELGWEPFVAAVGPGASVPDPVPLAWLASRTVLLLEDGHCLRDHAMSLCLLPGTQESPFRATSLSTLVQMVSAGLGVSVLPAMAVGTERSRSQIVARRLATDEAGRTLRMIWRRSCVSGDLLREIAASIRIGVSEVVGHLARDLA